MSGLQATTTDLSLPLFYFNTFAISRNNYIIVFLSCQLPDNDGITVETVELIQGPHKQHVTD